jgi:hypothetical protein
MTERIDHAREAEKCLALADTETSTQLISSLGQLAQAYATLALVEQQRVANRIALAQLEGQVVHVTGQEIIGNFPTSVWGRSDGSGKRVLREDIADAIGVGQ